MRLPYPSCLDRPCFVDDIEEGRNNPPLSLDLFGDAKVFRAERLDEFGFVGMGGSQIPAERRRNPNPDPQISCDCGSPNKIFRELLDAGPAHGYPHARWPGLL